MNVDFTSIVWMHMVLNWQVATRVQVELREKKRVNLFWLHL